MHARAASLPSGWTEFLENMCDRIEQLIIAAETRIDDVVALDTELLAQARRENADRLAACLDGLSEQLASAELLVEDVNASLQAGEEAMRNDVAACATLRQKLADCMGRAIK